MVHASTITYETTAWFKFQLLVLNINFGLLPNAFGLLVVVSVGFHHVQPPTITLAHGPATARPQDFGHRAVTPN